MVERGPGGRFTKMSAHFESKLTFCVFSFHLEFASSLLKSVEPFHKGAHF